MKQINQVIRCESQCSQIKDGYFKRKDDGKLVQRYRCKICGRRFSSATSSQLYRQKKRTINYRLIELLSSGVSMRRSSKILRLNRKTVERKLIFLGEKCRQKNLSLLRKRKKKIHDIQIDDLVTKENSKLKPLSITVAVDKKNRMILGAEVSQIPSFGHLAHMSRKKYGYREDKHCEGLKKLFETIERFVHREACVESDCHQKYQHYISIYLPHAKHITFESEKASVVGQGELKKIRFDPLFTINHTLAMMRANINRLIRKTWCTTKDPVRLKDHIDIFIYYYNKKILGLSPI